MSHEPYSCIYSIGQHHLAVRNTIQHHPLSTIHYALRNVREAFGTKITGLYWLLRSVYRWLIPDFLVVFVSNFETRRIYYRWHLERISSSGTHIFSVICQSESRPLMFQHSQPRCKFIAMKAGSSSSSWTATQNKEVSLITYRILYILYSDANAFCLYICLFFYR